MNTAEVLQAGVGALTKLQGQTLDILTIKKPQDIQSAVGLSKVISKLSPLVGNTIESVIVQSLNEQRDLWPTGSVWKRQDPEFPDAVLTGVPDPLPGFEIKAWMPLATEMTGRFRASQTVLRSNNINVVVVCWLPEYLISGQPKVLGVFVCNALEMAQARDQHYHNPPWYVLREPEDTSARTRNLQQQNVTGHLFQGTAEELESARSIVESWGTDGKVYRTDAGYQSALRDLMGRFSYRGETNFSKIDRIRMTSLEQFKDAMYRLFFIDRTISEWRIALSGGDIRALAQFVEGGVEVEALEKQEQLGAADEGVDE